MTRPAIGCVEVQGYSVALAVMDQACKAANITIKGIDCNNPPNDSRARIPVMIQVKFSGTVSDVQAALDVARETASRYLAPDEMLFHLIPSGSAELMGLLPQGKVSP
ncbi:BMC domain-containing protein, partial [Clostridium perfringens]|nr:BMC domain-containing protein [Clostridium perfringens]